MTSLLAAAGTSLVSALAPKVIQTGKQMLVQYLSNQLGDLKQSYPRTIGVTRQIVQDTFGNNRPIQQRLQKLQTRLNKVVRHIRSKSVPTMKRKKTMVMQDDWEDVMQQKRKEPEQQFKQNDYENDQDY